MQKIKLLTLTLSLFFVAANVVAQDKSERKSPPKQVEGTIDGVDITIDFSQPSKKGRQIFGGLVPFGKVWRTGANEASWIKVSDDVKIEGKTLKKGKYGLFTKPGEGTWEIIFNEKWDQWGAYDYDKSKDVLRVSVKPQKAGMAEKFDIAIDDDGFTMMWDNVKVPVKVSSK